MELLDRFRVIPCRASNRTTRERSGRHVPKAKDDQMRIRHPEADRATTRFHPIARRRRGRAGLAAARLVVGLGGAVPLAAELTTAPVAGALANGLDLTPQMGWNDWN